jgi:abortive infection bacteriophage resistance protein
MPYTDRALTVDEQVEYLLSKNLDADRELLTARLEKVSFHRLSGYWHSFREFNADDSDWLFRNGSRFDTVWDRYVFDRQLRLLVLDALERVEVAVRNDLILSVAVEQGPFGYLNPANFPNIEARDASGNTLYNHAMLLSHVRKVFRRELRSDNPVVMAYDSKYPDNDELLPYWMLLEIVEFGTLTHLLHGLAVKMKTAIANKYGLRTYAILDSWMDILRSARNTSAHLGRLWNRRNILKPLLPGRKNPEWHSPVDIEPVKDRAFGTLTILKYLLEYIAPQSRWADRLEALFAKHPRIDRKLLGYPENWRECPIWKDVKPYNDIGNAALSVLGGHQGCERIHRQQPR